MSQFIVIPKHFIPPMLVNAALGTILWATYAETYSIIEPHCGRHPIFSAGLAGGVAGGVQALLAAPAENVRILLEGGSGGSSWSKSWKDVFRGTRSSEVLQQKDIEDIRQLRRWMKDVGDMAGRGWSGWGWGLGKDMCGKPKKSLRRLPSSNTCFQGLPPSSQYLKSPVA